MRIEHIGAEIDVNFRDIEKWANPYPYYPRLHQAQGLAMCYRLGPLHPRAWVAARHADVSTVFKDVERFHNDSSASRDGGSNDYRDRWFVPRILRAFLSSMPFVDGEDHKRLRQLVAHAFTPARINDLEHHIAELSDGLLRAAMAKDSFDFMADFALPMPLQVIAEMLGVDEADRKEFHRRAHGLLDTSTPLQMMLDSLNMRGRYRIGWTVVVRSESTSLD